MGRKNFLMKGRLLFVLALEFRNSREGFINSRVNNTLSLTLSWIIRGVGGVTSDLHLTGLRPTENPLPQGRGCAKDIHASESRSPLLLQFYMERVPKAGEGIINLKPAHTKNFNTTVNLQMRCA